MRQQIDLLRSRQPVADINHWSFNVSGECINEQFEKPPYYLTGLEIPRLREKIRAGTKVILVAGANIAYVPAIRAILKAGLANILVTDHVTAELLMQSEKQP